MLKKTYNSMYNQIYPSDQLISSVIQQSDRRRSPAKRTLLATAMISVFLAATVTVFAVGYNLGSFDRLREIIGEEKAEILQPIEYSNVIGEFITDEGIRVELIAVGVFSNVVDFYFTLEDLVENRLEGDIRISSSVFPVDDQWHGMALTNSAEVIDRTADGIVTLHSRQVFMRPITGQKLQFNLHDISYNIRYGEENIDFNFASLAPVTPTTWLWDTPILPPNLHNIELELEGFENNWSYSISSIGILDGRLHIQQFGESFSQPCVGSSHFYLVDSRGEYVFPYMSSRWPTSILNFKIDENDNIQYDENPFGEGNHVRYREDIYEIELSQLSEYRLMSMFHTEDQIDLNWIATFEVDISDGLELVADELDIELKCCRAILREVRVTQSHVLIIADYIEMPEVSPYPRTVIHTADSSITARLSMFANIFDDIDDSLVGFTIVYELAEDVNRSLSDIDFLNLESVVSIEIAENVIDLQQ